MATSIIVVIVLCFLAQDASAQWVPNFSQWNTIEQGQSEITLESMSPEQIFPPDWSEIYGKTVSEIPECCTPASIAQKSWSKPELALPAFIPLIAAILGVSFVNVSMVPSVKAEYNPQKRQEPPKTPAPMDHSTKGEREHYGR